MGILYIVATPIGNLKDISFRALEILHNIEVIVCEDTRRTGIFLQSLHDMYNRLVHYTQDEYNKPRLISYYEQNELQRIPAIITLLKEGNNIALVSDAGTPTISDPGFKLVRECIKEGIRVESIPGPSSVITALTVSGLPTDKFLFVGYLPRKEGHRKKFLTTIQETIQIMKSTVILFEAPHKLIKTLQEMQEILGDISIVLARELTKLHEEVKREKISVLLQYYKKVNPKGEYVLLFHLNDS